ncbi:MAG: hypothetical protein R2853_17655 [Thermomicrobiales bacterium]
MEPNSEATPAPASEGPVEASAAAAAPPREVAPTQKLIDAEMRRMSRETRQHPESSVRADRQARNATRDAAEADPGETDEAVDQLDQKPEAEVKAAAVDATAQAADPVRASRAHRRRANTADRARRKNTSAPSEENLLLVRQLSLTNQQLNAAHRVIGRLSAERDILRQHFADAVGIPVNEVVVATDTDSTAETQKKVHVEAKPPSRMEKLNYFGGNDYAQMRRRRQAFVGVLFAIILVLWGLSRAGYWSMPDNISRDSLGQVPLIGDLMTYFLAGWLFFRVAKVSSKGVRWVFPTDKGQRRRR